MAFLALASQRSYLLLQKNFLQFQQLSIQNQINYAQSQMTAIAREYSSSDDDSDYSEDADYIYFEDLDHRLGTEQDLLQNQLDIISAEYDSMKNVISQNIKSSCTLNLAAGG